MSEAKWYILKTKTNCEARAKLSIEKIIKIHKVSDKVKQVLIPEKDVVEVVKGKKVTRPKKIYPGYIFIEMNLSNDLWHLIKKAASVIHFVGGTRARPLEVPEDQLIVVNKTVQESTESPQAQITFFKGETVLVIDGPFKNFNGVVEEISPDKGRVKVSVSIFGRPTPVEFDFSQVHREG